MPQDHEFDVDRGRAVLLALLVAVDAQMNTYGVPPQPTAGSTVETEAAEFPNSGAVKVAHSLAAAALVQAADHMISLDLLLAEPGATFAPWTVARGILEATSRVCWFTDPAVDAKTRASRGMAWRLVGQEGLRAFARSDSNPVGADVVQGADERIASIAREESQFDIQIERTKDGRVKLPTSTDMAIAAHGPHGGDAYRLLSALSHGRQWAVTILSMEPVAEMSALEKKLTPQGAEVLITWPLTWYSRAATRFFRPSGWDLNRLAAAIEEAFNGLAAANGALTFEQPDRAG